MRRFFSAESVLFLGLWLALMIVGRSALLRDPGTFWHTVLGEQMLCTGELVRTDSFTFTYSGERWLALQWLGEVAMAICHRISGWDGQLLLAATILAATYTWLGGRMLRSGLHGMPMLVVLAAVFAASSHHFHIRPHLISILFIGLTTAMLVAIETGRISLGRLSWLIPLFVVWTNVHGGVMAGLATVLLAVGGWSAFFLLRWPTPVQTARQFGLLTAIVLGLWGAMFVNPYGTEMPSAWLSIMSMNLPTLIEEHAPLTLDRAETWAVLTLATLYGISFLSSIPQRPRVTWLLPGVWLLLAFSRVRHAPLFAIVTGVVWTDLLPCSGVGRWLARREMFQSEKGWGLGTGGQDQPTNWWAGLVPLTVVLVTMCVQFAGIPLPVIGRGWACHEMSRWPVTLLPELKRLEQEAGGEVRVFNSLGFGGFLEYHTPGLKPFIDDRCELFGNEFLGAYVEAENHWPSRIDDWTAQFHCDIALVQRASPFDRHLRNSQHWELIGEDQAGALHRRIGPGS